MDIAKQPQSVEYPPLPPDLQGKSWFRLLKYFGPGAIIACVTIGSGETLFASRGGAIFGYSMLWCFVAGCFAKGFQVYSGSRFITLTGRHPLQSWMSIPGPRGWFVWTVAILTILCMPFWQAGLPKMLGGFTNWMTGVPLPAEGDAVAEAAYNTYSCYWGTLYIVVALVITWLQSYNFLEKAQTAIVGLLLVCMILAAVVSSPDLSALVLGFIPTIPTDYEPWIKQKYPNIASQSILIEVVVYLGVIGGGAQDYFGYLGMLREKAWGMMGRKIYRSGVQADEISTSAENIKAGRRWLLPAQIDIGISTLAILIFTVCFVILGATTLRSQQIAPDGNELLTQQSQFLVNLAGDSAFFKIIISWTYKTGIFFAFFGTILGAYEIFTRTIREVVVALFPKLIDVPLKRIRLFTIFYTGVGGFILMWLIKEPVEIVKPAALVGSGLVCGLWCFAMFWSDRVHVPKTLQMSLFLKICLFLSGCLLTVGSIGGIFKYIQSTIIPLITQ